MRTLASSLQPSLCACLIALLASFATFPAWAEESAADSRPDLLDEAVVRSAEQGLAYLAKVQAVDGSFPGGDYPNVCAALASMAFMASGHFPGRGTYGNNLERAVLWLAKRADQRGYFGGDGGRMYGHGMCALALAEAYGMLRSRKDNLLVKEALEKAVKLIVSCQTRGGQHDGGWRYEPEPGDADLSVTAWQVQALRGAQNCQIPVPNETISHAIGYLNRCYSKGHKGFAYQPGQAPSLAMMCAGIVVMHTLKEADSDLVREAGKRALAQSFNEWGGSYFYYRSYYAAIAGLMLGEEGQKAINTPLEKLLLSKQNADGSWPEAPNMGAGRQAGPVYFTSFACLVLAARYQYLPIYQE
jgi:hypothetical protein